MHHNHRSALAAEVETGLKLAYLFDRQQNSYSHLLCNSSLLSFLPLLFPLAFSSLYISLPLSLSLHLTLYYFFLFQVPAVLF